MAEVSEPRQIVEVYQNGNRTITTINDGCVFYEVYRIGKPEKWHSVVEIKRDLSG